MNTKNDVSTQPGQLQYRSGIQTFLALLLAGPSLTWAVPASVDVVYGPADTAVPTLGEWGLLLTAALLALMALWALRRNSRNRSLILTVLTVIGLAASWLHGTQANLAWATAGPSNYDMNNPLGGTITVPGSAGGGSVTLANTTQVPLRIVSVTPSGYTLINTTCQPGTVVAVAASCVLNTIPPPT